MKVNYERPPVREVIAGVSFSCDKSLLAPHLGIYWKKVRARFPKLDQHEPLTLIIERFASGIKNVSRNVNLEFPTGRTTPRLWMISEDDSELLQVQGNMFLRNWRNYHSGLLAYPRYDESIRKEFEIELNAFKEFLEEEGFGSYSTTQVQLTYINYIEPNAIWSSIHDISKVFKGWNPESDGHDLLGGVENINLNITKIIEYDGKPIGRLYLNVKNAMNQASGKPVFIVELVARGNPIKENDVFGFLDLGREHIVRNFSEITTEEIQNVWGKYD